MTGKGFASGGSLSFRQKSLFLYTHLFDTPAMEREEMPDSASSGGQITELFASGVHHAAGV